ncbi:hypothetical protein CMUS01_06882 [Colletotrichum musicola]|uniref:Uncharacterized protein n=1 Tax=Colletotrichum musicola TaxID=2175873 RepID=A0A8H6NHD5_9PEZI|nr:hypothetical protein CMUS01_06882 [Colletotrichum musicola]
MDHPGQRPAPALTGDPAAYPAAGAKVQPVSQPAVRNETLTTSEDPSGRTLAATGRQASHRCSTGCPPNALRTHHHRAPPEDANTAVIEIKKTDPIFIRRLTSVRPIESTPQPYGLNFASLADKSCYRMRRYPSGAPAASDGSTG